MKSQKKIPLIIGIIFIGIASIFAVIQYTNDLEFKEYLNKQQLIEQNSIPVEITGAIKVVHTIEGYEYHFTPDSSEQYKIQETSMDIVVLESSWEDPVKLEQSLDDKKVKINGLIKKINGNFDEHLWSGFPVIIVKQLEVLN